MLRSEFSLNLFAKERFPITGQGFASGKLLDGMECQILLDTGATKSYIVTEDGPVSHFWGFIFLFETCIQYYFLIWVVTLILPCFICHCLGINNISLFYSFVYVVSLFLSQTYDFFGLVVIDFSTCPFS